MIIFSHTTLPKNDDIYNNVDGTWCALRLPNKKKHRKKRIIQIRLLRLEFGGLMRTRPNEHD